MRFPRLAIRRTSGARTLAVAAFLVLGFALQAHFFRAFPQPILFGDPAGYYTTGQRFLEAFNRVSAGGSVVDAFSEVRGFFYLFGVGSLFALLEAVKPGDFAFFHLFFAACNTMAMLGAFLLARSLTRSFACGLLALALAAVYPSFALQTGRLYPDPLTGGLFVWAAWAYAEGVARARRRWMAVAGLLFVAALIIRLQIALYMMLVLPIVFAITASCWLRSRNGRGLALMLALSIMPIYGIWAGVARAVGDRDDVTRLGNYSFDAPYLMGFWQQLETDGWVGPYRLKKEPYYAALEARNRVAPGLLSSRLRQIGFITDYVLKRPVESMLIVINNAYRLFDRPANDYKRDYPFSYDLQIWFHRSICVLALCGIALHASRSGALLGAFLMPLSLLPLHGILFSWPRYNMPAMPLLIAAAGAFAGEVLFRHDARRALFDRRSLLVTGVGASLLFLGMLVFTWAPEIGHVLSVAGTASLLAVPFVVTGILATARRRIGFTATAYLALVILLVGHVLRDRLWHEQRLAVGRNMAGIEQEIRLSNEAVVALRQAKQSYIVMDMRIPRGDRTGVTIAVQGRELSGELLDPTMPPLGESTFAGGRDWRGCPQWWALSVEPWMIPSSASHPLRIALRVKSDSTLDLAADRFSAQGDVYEGPSFSDWPNWVALKMEYDDDSRLPVRMRLASRETISYAIEASGARRRLRSVARIRVISIGNNEGTTVWLSAPSPSRRAAWGFCAYSTGQAQATLAVDDRVDLRFPLEAQKDFDVTVEPYALCRRMLPEKGYKPYAGYVLVGPAPTYGGALRLRLSFLTGMSHKPVFFVVDRKWDRKVLEEAYRRCTVSADTTRVDGVARVVSANRNNYPDDTGWWTAETVY